VLLIRQKTVLEPHTEHSLDRPQLRVPLGVIRHWIYIYKLLHHLLFLFLPLFHQFGDQTAKFIVSNTVFLRLGRIAGRTLVLSIDYFEKALFAERVTAFRYVRVLDGLETDDAVGQLVKDILN
jgi:hypothetical protein